MEGTQLGFSSPIPAQLVMPWFMGPAWIPKFADKKEKFGEWGAQVEAMLRAQELTTANGRNEKGNYRADEGSFKRFNARTED